MARKHLLGLICACAIPALACAGSTAELRVTGRIVPEACVPSFVGGGVVDYGIVPSRTLSADAPSALSRKAVGLSVSCAMPTSVAIRLLDNRPPLPASGMVKTSARPSSAPDDRYFGLATEPGKPLAAYVLRFETANGVVAPSLQLSAGDDGSGAVWRARPDGMLHKDTLYTWAAEGGLAPARLQHMGATLSVQPMIDRRGDELTDDIPLDGSATLELVYF